MRKGKLAAALGAAAAFGVASFGFVQTSAADTYSSDPYYGDEVVYEDDGITVVAPYSVHRERQRGPLGARTEVVSVSRIVYARDLDLRYAADVRELRQRVTETARLACEEADDIVVGPSVTSDRDCVREAVNDAMPQFRAVVARARY